MPSDKLYPGVCDFHVHVGEKIGGYTLRDDFLALDEMAEDWGIVAIGAFVTEEPNISLKDKLRGMQDDAAQHFRGHVHWHLTPVSSTPEEVIPLLKGGCDLKFYTTYKDAGLYSSIERIEFWMKELGDLKTRILVHCEDDGIVSALSAAIPFKEPFDHTRRRPAEAEYAAVSDLMEIAVKYSHPVHVVHISSFESAIPVRQAKKSFSGITCETAPQYLLYDEEKFKGPNAHRWLCTPPLRPAAECETLIDYLNEGFFDIIASDHCAFTPADKDRFKDTPEKVPMGIPGLPFLFLLLYQKLVISGRISLDRLLDLCCYRPAELMGISVKEEFTLQKLSGVRPEDQVIRTDNGIW
jgi:dihydropyrimidinase